MAKVVSESMVKTVLFSLVFLVAPCKVEAGGAALDQAKAFYQKKQFSDAAKSFQKLVDGGDRRAIVYLYLAHSRYMASDKEGAVKVYQKIVNEFPGTSEANMAAGALRKFGDGTSRTTASNRKQAATLIKRIDVIPPRFGHPPVSESTINIVKGVISKLPERLYRILDEGGAKIHIASNMLDRYPHSLHDKHPADGHLYCNEPGRTYDLEMYIWERPLAQSGFKDVGDMWTEKQIEIATYMQCAHALDYLMEHLSSESAFKKFYWQDLKAMTQETKDKLTVLSADTDNARIETFGEIMLLEMGVETHIGTIVKDAFPRTRLWVKDSIKRIKLK